MLEEIDSDKKWDSLSAESEDVLGQLALAALSEEKQGRTKELDMDEL